MINPGLVSISSFASFGQTALKVLYGSIAYSIICGYLILRLLRHISAGRTDKLIRYMSVMLCLLSVLFVYIIFGTGFGNMLDSFTSLRSGNVGNENQLRISYVFLVIQFIADSLPYALNIIIIFAALRLLREMHINRFSTEAVTAAKRISKLCITAIVTTILANIFVNLLPVVFLQILFAGSLQVLNTSIQIPIFSIIFVIAMLLLTRLITENKQLKDDNNMFI